MADPRAELRAVAEKATPGPWWAEDEIVWAVDDSAPPAVAFMVQTGDEVDDQHGADAAFIAAASPDVVLALLNDAELVGVYKHRAAEADAELVGLRAELEAARDPRQFVAVADANRVLADERARHEATSAELAEARRKLDEAGKLAERWQTWGLSEPIRELFDVLATSRPSSPVTSRRYEQCDETCTVDCGHCKGNSPPSSPVPLHCPSCNRPLPHNDVEQAACSSPVTENSGEPDEPCDDEKWSWDYFSTEAVDPYWMRCNKIGPHNEHENSDTGATWPASENSSEGADRG